MFPYCWFLQNSVWAFKFLVPIEYSSPVHATGFYRTLNCWFLQIYFRYVSYWFVQNICFGVKCFLRKTMCVRALGGSYTTLGFYAAGFCRKPLKCQNYWVFFLHNTACVRAVDGSYMALYFLFFLTDHRVGIHVVGIYRALLGFPQSYFLQSTEKHKNITDNIYKAHFDVGTSS